MPSSNSYKPEYLPPASVGRWRLFERSGLQIRAYASLGIHARLDPFALANSFGLVVLDLDQLPGLSQASKDLLTKGGAWSGGATTKLPDGRQLILLNPAQSQSRRAATLMEEVCHILLGHKPTPIGAEMMGGRDFDRLKEEEAYAVGAAALLPYFSLKSCLTSGLTLKTIAQRYGVSTALVAYRCKGLKLEP